jgi:PAS domain S-box-containing protein
MAGAHCCGPRVLDPGKGNDVTAGRRAQADLYRLIVDVAREGFWLMGPDGLTSFVNPRTTELLGYSPEEMIGRPLTEFQFPDDVAAQFGWMEEPQQGRPNAYELQLRRKDHQPLWALVSVARVTGPEGQPALWRCSPTSPSARRSSRPW